jgi:hypothetical protein
MSHQIAAVELIIGIGQNRPKTPFIAHYQGKKACSSMVSRPNQRMRIHKPMGKRCILNRLKTNDISMISCARQAKT